MTAPILWSFRRCPYAMRARLAIQAAGQRVELREILLRDKPRAFLDTSASGTVPALRDGDMVLDESLDIMLWALRRHDPQGLLDMPPRGWDLIRANDGPFKAALDRTKYAARHPDHDPLEQRAIAAGFLAGLEPGLGGGWLLGSRPTLADHALLPFVRQFAGIDRAWFDAQPWPALRRWLDSLADSAAFQAMMIRHPPWSDGQAPVWFP